MTSLIFYTNPMSRGRIVRWMLEEIGTRYETVFLSYGNTMKEADYLAINPMGKVPAIKHGDTIVTECAAICAYLADTFPEANLAPALNQRGAYYRWLFFAAGPVENATTNNTFGWIPNPKQQRTLGYGNFETTCNTLIKAVSGGGFICAEQFTAADVYVGSQIGWGLQFGTIPPSPELKAYSERVHDRAAYKRAAAIDDAAMGDHGPPMPAP